MGPEQLTLPSISTSSSSASPLRATSANLSSTLGEILFKVYSEQIVSLRDAKKLYSLEDALTKVATLQKFLVQSISVLDSSAPKYSPAKHLESFRNLRGWLQEKNIIFNLGIEDGLRVDPPWHVSAYVFTERLRHTVPTSGVKLPGLEAEVQQIKEPLQLSEVEKEVPAFRMQFPERVGGNPPIITGTVVDVARRGRVALLFPKELDLVAMQRGLDRGMLFDEVFYNELGHVIFNRLTADGDPQERIRNIRIAGKSGSVETSRLQISEAFSDFVSLSNTPTSSITLGRLQERGGLEAGYAFSAQIKDAVFDRLRGGESALLPKTMTDRSDGAIYRLINSDKAFDQKVRELAIQVYSETLTPLVHRLSAGADTKKDR